MARIGKTDIFSSTAPSPTPTASSAPQVAPSRGERTRERAPGEKPASAPSRRIMRVAPVERAPVERAPVEPDESRADSSEASPQVSPSEVRRNGPGRPPVHTEEYQKVTVVLLNRQIVFLDALTNAIRARSGKAIKRAELLRAAADAIQESGLDLSGALSEEDVKTQLLQKLRA